MSPTTPAPEDVRLPDTAFRPLQQGESYQPLVPADAPVPEVTLRSIVQGVVWAIVFSAAATYIALKLGQGIESAIPISILAVGFSAFAVRCPARAGLHTARERQRAGDRRDLRHRRRRLGLHDAGHLHPRPRGPLVLPADLPRAAAGRHPGRLPARAVPPLLRARPPRQAALPRGPGHDRDPGGRPARRPQRRRARLLGPHRGRLRLRGPLDEGLDRELLDRRDRRRSRASPSAPRPSSP